MEDRRQERIARNEARFREINERLSEGLRRVAHNPELLDFICECGNKTCEEHVRLSFGEYEEVRRDSRRFAVVPGHEVPDAERVVGGNDRFTVVEKVGEAADLVDAADERTRGTTGLRHEPD